MDLQIVTHGLHTASQFVF